MSAVLDSAAGAGQGCGERTRAPTTNREKIPQRGRPTCSITSKKMGPRNGSTLGDLPQGQTLYRDDRQRVAGVAQGLADLDVRSRTGSGTATSRQHRQIYRAVANEVQGVLALITGMRRVPSFAELTERAGHDVTKYYRPTRVPRLNRRPRTAVQPRRSWYPAPLSTPSQPRAAGFCADRSERPSRHTEFHLWSLDQYEQGFGIIRSRRLGDACFQALVAISKAFICVVAGVAVAFALWS